MHDILVKHCKTTKIQFISSFLSNLTFAFSVDTHRTQSRVEWNRSWRCNISQSSIAKQHSKIQFISVKLNFCIFSRHSHYSTSDTIELELKVHDISVKHYKTTQ